MNPNRRPMAAWVPLLVAALCVADAGLEPSLALAQVTAATITGTVSDESGGIVPDATVKATNSETGATRTAVTDGQGRYRFASLPVGLYDIKVERAGFRTSIWKDVNLDVGQTVLIDLVLKVSPVTLEVIVTSPAPLINANSAELSYLVEEKKIEALPLNGRNFTDLALLQPGVQAFRNRQGGSIVAVGLQLNINGQEGRSNVYLLDGTITNNVTNGPASSGASTALGMEAVREFRVETNSYSAEFGRNMGGQINAITKSGTNKFHGSLFEFHRNDNLDARNFFDRKESPDFKRLPEFKRNQFGFSLGGPIRRDKTHFFGAYEGLRENLGRTVTSTTPDLNARNGQLCDRNGANCSAATIRPEVKPYLDLFPLPNGEALGGGLARFRWAFQQLTDVDFLQLRLDHQFSNHDQLFGRYTLDDAGQQRGTAYPQFPNPFLSRNQFYTQQYQRTFSTRMVHTFRFGFSRTKIGQDVAANFSTPVAAFIPGRPIIGDIDIGGLPRFGPQVTANFRGIQNVFSYSDDMNYTKGKHTLKAGALVERYQDNLYNPTFSLGIFTFADLKSFLENRPLRFLGMTPASTFDRYWRSTLAGLYFQDEMRLRRNLTLTLGLRHEFATVPRDIQNRDSALLSIADADVTIGPAFRTSKWKKFAPRFGFAWDPFGTMRTSVRGGFGMYFNTQIQQNMLVTLGNLPAAERFVIPSPTFPVATFRPGLGRSMRPFDYNLKIPNSLIWNLNIQREVARDTLVTVGYAGSRGIHLIRAGDVNTVIPQTQPDGSLFFPLGAARPNPAWGTLELPLRPGPPIPDLIHFLPQHRHDPGCDLFQRQHEQYRCGLPRFWPIAL